MTQILKKGIKYVKINKVDALGNDKTSLLRQLQNIRVVYSDSGVKQYNVYGVTEYPTYFQYQIDYTNITSSIDTGILNYQVQTTSSTGTWAGPFVSSDQATPIISMSNTPISNSRFNTSSGVYKLQSTTLEHYPNTVIQITASVAYVPNPPGNPIYPQLWLTPEGTSTPIATVTASAVTVAGTLVLTASLNSATLAPLTQASRGGIRFQVYNDEGTNPAQFSDFRLRINQADSSSNYTQRLVVPSPNTNLKFTGTDCDVTYGFVDRYDLSQYFMDVDYATGIAVPTNQTALISGSATKAPVKDYYYNLKAQTTPRYSGVKVSQLELNKYTGPSNTLYIDGNPYPGDVGYGKSPNIELRRAYVAWFNSLYGATPEVNNAVNVNIKYLIDGLGNTYSPELTRFFLPELVGNFTNGDTLTLNFVDDVSGTNTTPSDIKTALNGSRKVIRSGMKAGAVLYSQTGSGVDAYTQSLQFTTIENGSAYKNLTDYRFGVQQYGTQTIPANTRYTASFDTVLWDFSGGYSTVTDTYTFPSTPQSRIRLKLVIKGVYTDVSNNSYFAASVVARRGTTSLFLPGDTQTIELKRKDRRYDIEIVTNYRNFLAGDKIWVNMSNLERTTYVEGPIELVAEQELLTQQALPSAVAPYFFTSSTDPYILTASLQFSSSIDQVYQVGISGSGFDAIRSKISFNQGDQIRFENNELNTYTINKIISSSTETSNGETHLLLDRPISNGTNVNYFLLRRYYTDSSNIIIEGIKPAGGSGPGSISPQYITQQLQDNLSTIVAKLSRENSI